LSLKTQYSFWMLIVLLTATVRSQAQDPGVLTPFSNGLTSPVVIANAGDSRLFVANEPGSISIVDSAGNVKPEFFLDITNKVIFGGEQGLLGLAFHPDYKNNGYFYVNYIGAGDSTHISRFSILPGHPDKADSLSEMKIMTIAQPYKNHNGGNLAFGPDGYLYIGLGDGGSGGDPENRAQNPLVFLGKILRIDVDHGNPYTIPDSNPYYALSSVRNEIWALGLRNPWRFSFDRKTGDLWIADVGQNALEEINFQPAGSHGGENYGWRCYEGEQPYNQEGCAPADSFTFPVYTYPHGDECSVTGGFVYRGDSLSPYYGKYFFADYCSDRIWTLHKDATGWAREDFGQFAGNGFSTFGEDNKGELYVAGHSNGIIYRIASQATGLSPEKELSGIQFFNDPSSRKFRLEINSGIATEAILSIYDMQGAVRFRDKITDEKYEFSTSRLPYGVYLINLEINGKYWSHKLIIER
jgi:glucose/arabinose dehydrogenase